ncbi:hypothetical protein, partial [Aquabacterium parvum]|uniref:hypothetical protein n=1 Tax=Aquabacterium parvum TaxID=70584 RepID=UPI001F18FA8A
GYKGFPICQAKTSPGDSPKAIHLEPSNHQNTNPGISRAEVYQGIRTATLQPVFNAASMCCGP